LHFLYKFEYQANFGEEGSEHELCWVYVGRSDEQVVANRNEVDDWRFVAPEQLEREMAAQDAPFTPWFKMEWQRVKDCYRDILKLD
jgi:isopentenyl-diphosphate delta-isomerase